MSNTTENNVGQWDMSNNDKKNDSKKYVMKGYWESEIYDMAVNGMYGILITEKGSDVSAILHMNYDKYCSYRPGDPSDVVKVESSSRRSVDDKYTEHSLKRELRSVSSRTRCTIF